jgi:hypothetical protein
MPVRDRLAGRIPPIRTRRVTGNSLGSLRQIVNRSRYRSPWAELAPFEHAPLPVLVVTQLVPMCSCLTVLPASDPRKVESNPGKHESCRIRVIFREDARVAIRQVMRL